MTTQRTDPSVSRRTALAGLGEIEFRALDGTRIEGPYGPFPVDGKRVRVETAFALVTAAASPVATPAP